VALPHIELSYSPSLSPLDKPHASTSRSCLCSIRFHSVCGPHRSCFGSVSSARFFSLLIPIILATAFLMRRRRRKPVSWLLSSPVKDGSQSHPIGKWLTIDNHTGPVTDYGSTMVHWMRNRHKMNRPGYMTEMERPSPSYIVDVSNASSFRSLTVNRWREQTTK
jgi:hypothetical protein